MASDRGTTISSALAIAAAAVIAAAGSGCSSAQSGGPTLIEAPPPAETRATLVGARCDVNRCQCRDLNENGADEPPPPAGFKRFEVRIGPTQDPVWVSVKNMVLYKSTERAEECFYIDLPPGKHLTSIRAKARPNEGGFGAQVRVSELSGGGPWWYPTFTFTCGASGLCDQATLDAWRAGLARFTKNLHAPCGSVKIRSVQWETGRMPDNLHPEDLQIELILDIYKFATQHPPGSQECG